MKTILTLILLTIGFLGCTSDDSGISGSPKLSKGDHPFRFDEAMVEDLEIRRADPEGPKTFAARFHNPGAEKRASLERKPHELEAPGHNWTISSATTEESLRDRYANSNLIHHLLSSLNTLKVVEDLGKQSDLESLGLSPAFTVIRFKLARTKNFLEVHLGDRQDKTRATYARFVSSSNPERVYTVSGVTLQLLRHAMTLEALRLQKVATFGTNDVVEFEATSQGRKFYAQRQSGGWADRKNKPLQDEVGVWLEKLIHGVEADQFIENEADYSEIRGGKWGKKQFTYSFKSRQGAKTLIEVYARSGELRAVASDRSGTVFGLPTETVRILDPPR